MRIRGRKPVADCSVSVSLSPSSSSSSDSSSITGAHSLASSQDSSNSYPFSLCASASHRCHGLDLLVKAIHQVTAGSVVGVPYIQRRVTIRRRRRQRCLEFDHFLSDELPRRKREKNAKKVNKIDSNNTKKMKKTKGKNLMGLPPRIQDSVLHPWGRRSDLVGEMGL
ncbi:hypothetical protein CDL12_28730 [Handroanthus impetiginosus]|uniref:Uncharacterized protein n=1 Tax=Handroanthus impetiginosus TaxID=429701 RepID=A0A2G9G0D4_9LAMI|nr:hypothetical protein CDL12_28730 [Handroanthus impetiginosus]